MGDNDSGARAMPTGTPSMPGQGGQLAMKPNQFQQQFQAFAAGQQFATQFAQHYAQQQTTTGQTEQLRAFWAEQMTDVENVPSDPAEFKNHQLPLARIKKIMKSDEDVRMISAEAPVLFAKACEMFILELTLRSWNHAEENKRRTLQRLDVAAAITRTDIFDFLVDIVPREEIKQEGEGMTVPAAPGAMPTQGQPPNMLMRAPNSFFPPYQGGAGGPGMPGMSGGGLPQMPMFQQQQFMQNMAGQNPAWAGAAQMQGGQPGGGAPDGGSVQPGMRQ